MHDDSLLASMDARLRHVEGQVAEIHRALVGSTDGTARGLQARVEKLESWARWIGAVTTALVIGLAMEVLQAMR